MKISLLPLSQSELDEAFSWYEEQAVGLGYEFLDLKRRPRYWIERKKF
jgi:hypothetical protein